MELDHDTLADLGVVLERVRLGYERYFQGIDKRPPEQEYSMLKSNIRRMREIHTTNTGLKFRRESLTNKFMVLSRMWMRTMKEIEEGRYHKHKFKAELHEKAKAEDHAIETKPGTPKPSEGGLDDQAITDLHKQYMIAKLECNESTKGITRESLAKSIQKTIPQLEQKYKGRKFEFKVVVENGKTKLKAVPK